MSRKHHQYIVPNTERMRAFQLQESTGFDDVAWVQRDDFRYVAHATDDASCVMNLVQGVYDTSPKLGQWIFRTRLFTTSSPSEADAALCKVAASKVSFDVEPCTHKKNEGASTLSFIDASSHEKFFNNNISCASFYDVTHAANAVRLRAHKHAFQDLKSKCDDNNWPMQLVDMLGKTLTKDALEAAWFTLSKSVTTELTSTNRLDLSRARPIFAALVEQESDAHDNKTSTMMRVLAISRNDAAANKTLHAEMVLMQSLRKLHPQEVLSRRHQVWVTLQSCRMCAAHLVANNVATVVYGKEDTGRLATNTLLQKYDFERALLCVEID